MFREESIWIKNALSKLPLSSGSQVANLGSSTAHFRQNIQPHIHSNVIIPLKQKELTVFNIDLKDESGVDIQADLTNPNFPTRIGKKFELVLCTNILEHVESIPDVINNLLAITKREGYILITVPRKYPLHYDPIDNQFRPKPKAIISLFSDKTNFAVLESIIIPIKDISYYPIKKSSWPLWGYRSRLKYFLGFYYQVTGVLIKLN